VAFVVVMIACMLFVVDAFGVSAKQYSALELLPSRRRRMWEFVGYVEKV